MRGIVYTGERAEVTGDLEVRDPGPTEVTVRIEAAGLCHSDVSVIDGTIPWPSPTVLGHEGAGVVDAVGPAVTSLQPGDHVVLTTLASCGLCDACGTGHPTWCRQTMGNAGQPFTVGGEPAWNFAATSVFVERTVVSQAQAVKIPADVPLTSASLIGCGVLTGVGAVLNRARLAVGDTAAVFGVGGVGLNVIQGCRIAGASRIIAVDTVPEKEKLARQFGATDFIDASATDGHTPGTASGASGAGGGVVDALKELLPNGVRWAFECVGHPGVIRTAIDVLDWGGNAVILGVAGFTEEFSVPVLHLTHVDRGVMGCRYGSVQPHKDIPLYADLYRRGSLLLDELVSATYPLEEFDRAVHDLHEGKLARGVLTFS